MQASEWVNEADKNGRKEGKRDTEKEEGVCTAVHSACLPFTVRLLVCLCLA